MQIVSRTKFILFLVASSLASLVFLAVVFAAFGYRQVSSALNERGAEKNFRIETGESLPVIAGNLEKQEIIRSDFWFAVYVSLRGWTKNLQAGEYVLSPAWDMTEVAETITGGKVADNEMTVTIPEGFGLKDIDRRLAEAGLIRAGELMAKRELEGYLFPDTYIFDQDAALDEIISKMRSNFDKKLDQSLRDEIARRGKTIKEIIIMASLIEKEVRTKEDMEIVSGVFWQRISDKYPLQSDAPLSYILGDDKPSHTIAETQINSAYNTYKNVGLPPGPICSPGLIAITAAVYPKQTDYYFFLSAPDGQTIFSRTLQEHEENKKRYLAS